MWFADLAVGAAWLVLAGWLGWSLLAALIRRRAAVSPPRRRNTAVVFGGGIAATLNLAQAGVLDSVEDRTGVSQLDQPMLNWTVAHCSPDLTLFAKTVSVVGGTITWTVVTVVVVLWLSRRRRRLEATLFAVAGGGAGLLVTGVKQIMDRSRPPVADRLVVVTNPSLPSGHALSSIVVIGMLTVLVLGRVATLAVRIAVLAGAAVAVFLIGWSRVYLGVHWSTDVLAGWLLGATWLTTCITLLAVLSRYPPRIPAMVARSSSRPAT